MNVEPDFDYTKPESDTRLEFVHRKLSERRPLFRRQPQRSRDDDEATFRVVARRRNFGMRRRQDEACVLQDRGGRTTVPLHLEPWGTVFVVFRKYEG
jgi:hypothetical protein